jgi:hypothetical protein
VPIRQNTKAVDTVDLKILWQTWSHSREVSLIYPPGKEKGFDATEKHVWNHQP